MSGMAQGEVRDVPVVRDPGRAEFADIVRQGRPTVLRGVLDGWPALRNWSPEHLREKAGHRSVPIEFYGSWYGAWTTVPMRLSRYLDLLTPEGEPERCYLAQVNLADHLPELLDDVPIPDVLKGADAGVGAFLGRDSVTALHYHTNDEALLCQIGGEKRVTLWEPGAYRALRLHHPLSYRFNFSRIDFDRAPGARAQAGPRYEATLRSGDALFIPLFWGHLVENTGLSTSVTFFWPAVHRRWEPLPLALRSRLGFSFRRRVGNPVVDGLQRALGYS
ncbi:cupin-like domain-containing protein [Spirillospora sp. NPDC050679]